MPRAVSKWILRSLLAAFATLGAPLAADLGPLEPLADLHRAVHETLGLPEPMIVRALERGLPDEDLPVVGLIAARASVPLESVVDLRLGGMSYADITVRFDLSPEIFYVPFDADPGPPYGNAWGHFKKTPRERWRTLRLADADVVQYANLRLCVDRYRVAPVEVVAMRRKGHGFAVIHRDLVVKTKGSAKASTKASKSTAGDKSKAKSAKSKAKGGKKAKSKEKAKPPSR
jgi:hypothetical protein